MHDAEVRGDGSAQPLHSRMAAVELRCWARVCDGLNCRSCRRRWSGNGRSWPFLRPRPSASRRRHAAGGHHGLITSMVLRSDPW